MDVVDTPQRILRLDHTMQEMNDLFELMSERRLTTGCEDGTTRQKDPRTGQIETVLAVMEDVQGASPQARCILRLTCPLAQLPLLASAYAVSSPSSTSLTAITFSRSSGADSPG